MKVSNRISRAMLFEDGLPIIFEVNGKKGIKMSNGERVVPSIYNSIKELDMLTVQYSVELDAKYGVLEIDYDGNITTKLELEYDLFQRLKYGEYYLVRKNNKYGIWHNDLSLPCEYDSIQLLENDDFLISKDGKYGVCNGYNNIPCEYDEISCVEYELIKKCFDLECTTYHHYLLLRKGGKYGLWSTETGLLPSIYDEILTPTDEWGFKVNKNGIWGYLDKNNNFTTDISEVPLEWENLDDVGNGISF